MLKASFRHIRGIGPMRERQLWMQGVGSWEALPEGTVLAERLDEKLRAGVVESRARFAAGDLDFFARALPETEHWRLLPHLLEQAGFVDVETAEEVTVIGVLDAEGPRSFVRGRDLEEFPARAARWRAVVTFNGTAFDLPHLRRLFPGWQPPAAHVDLCILLRRLGEAGGLKQIEPRLGLHRPPHLLPLSGTDAVWLWHAQRQGDRTALRRLLEYNLHDAFHLRPIAEIAYNRMLRRTRMPAPALPVTERGALLYDVNRAVERALQ
ncbi:MAG TPA: ribonuclease H-like domain-containing protein [Myxococcales bacterium]|nr:ribonuclease H-like domain-containing protein [Myxococcales bacterium]